MNSAFKIQLDINGEVQEIEVTPSTSLNDVLRYDLSLTGAKRGCDTGGCGVCTVLLNDQPVYSCMTPAWSAQGKRILTVEGMEKEGKLHPLQESFIKNTAMHCGYCTSAMLLVAKSILTSNPNASEEEIRSGLCGVLCRCTGYQSYVEAILHVSASKK